MSGHPDREIPASPAEELHPLIAAVRPLADRIGAMVVPAQNVLPTDVPLVWDGEVVGGVRLPPGDISMGLERLIADVEDELGASLDSLDRAGKQRAVRLLEDRGAFRIRRSAETVAEALGVTRFTVYNYLNRER